VSTLSRTDQDQVVRWVLGALTAVDGTVAPLPSMSLDRFTMAGLATGLTALVEALRERHKVSVPPDWAPLLAEQRREVAARQARFAAVLPTVLRALHNASVPAIPIKGAVLARSVWPFADARPMADLDLIIAAADRGHAREALTTAGLSPHGSNAWEDTYLAWGDGSVGRTDGESAAHNGKVELHPGWVERLHNYLVDDSGLVVSLAELGMLAGESCRLLPPGAFAAQVVGHLSASVVRCEVRAVNLIDVVLLLPTLDTNDEAQLHSLVERLDGRLTAPGLWLVERYAPGTVPAAILRDSMSRLPSAAVSQLNAIAASDVFRTFDARTGLAWRKAFTTTWDERARMARQMILPTEGDSSRGLFGSQVDRVGRVLKRQLTGRRRQ
jgi:hypothetical protein